MAVTSTQRGLHYSLATVNSNQVRQKRRAELQVVKGEVIPTTNVCTGKAKSRGTQSLEIGKGH